MKNSVQIQNATITDSALVLDFIQKKAEFDSSFRAEPCIVSNTLDKIEQALFSPEPSAKVIFARENKKDVSGFALYHTRYSSFTGIPSLWLDDLYVDANQRSKGIGLALIVALEEKGAGINASHISWNASDKNTRGKNFYKRLGAEVERTEGSLLFYRYSIGNK